uniref:Activin_recp domain-containing protein n=1 Tax=Syphacia muris TaxID=451379 RepID=A0A0N5ARF5_9BILA
MLLSPEATAIVCYQCDAVDVANNNCSTAQNCTGKACVILLDLLLAVKYQSEPGSYLYNLCNTENVTLCAKNDGTFCLNEQANSASTSTFCVHDLPVNLEVNISDNRSCWMDPDKIGKHCICGQNMCNKPRDPSASLNEKETLPISNATLIKNNPLIDYDDTWDDDDNGMNSKPLPGNLLFLNAADTDPRIAGDSSKNNEFGDSDLVPIDHANYEYDDEKIITKGQQTVSTTERKLHYHSYGSSPSASKVNNEHHHQLHHSTTEEPSYTTEKPNSGKCSIPPVFLLFFSSVAAVARLFS